MLLPVVFIAGVLLSGTAPAPSIGAAAAPTVRDNSNTESAGVLRDGVLIVALEAKPSVWRFADGHPAMTVPAFSETGKPPLMPAPFIRAPAGTELRFTIRNSLASALTVVMPAAMHGGPDRINAMDSVVVAPGAVGTLTTRATVAGNYVYRGKLPDGVTKVSNMAGILAGAIVIDSERAAAPPRDRVLVIMATEDSISAVCDDSATVPPLSECPGRRFMYTINGTQWPNTDRLHATVGDSLHWRVINASFQVHPMHLHGFYFRVDELSGPLVDATSRPMPGSLVVTQLLSPLSSMSLTWSPDRPGNWLFHCHVALHNTTYSLLSTAGDAEMRDMVGLVVGTIVAPRRDVVASGSPVDARRIRLVAESEPSAKAKAVGDDASARMHFVVEERGKRTDTDTDWSPELDLVRGEPVAVTIVNHLREPTAVHWHGIEVDDSYMDGAAGFSGQGRHLAPMIAPGDSFVARFTPHRAGTFMYHSHVNELLQELNGLDGALIVREPDQPISPDDHVFFLKGSPGPNGGRAHPLEIDGQSNPDTVVLHVGRTARLRLINLVSGVGAATPTFSLTSRSDSAATIASDTSVVAWRPVAKDGFDIPEPARKTARALQLVSVGETYDFEYTPRETGLLRLEVRGNNGAHALFVRVPIRVE
jgi:FtsP/CotA-like multicopper oxidase with cupredoxin domain